MSKESVPLASHPGGQSQELPRASSHSQDFFSKARGEKVEQNGSKLPGREKRHQMPRRVGGDRGVKLLGDRSCLLFRFPGCPWPELTQLLALCQRLLRVLIAAGSFKGRKDKSHPPPTTYTGQQRTLETNKRTGFSWITSRNNKEIFRSVFSENKFRR